MSEYILTSDGELYHWKYIKREKRPNGKYRYYYKDDKYDEIHDKYWDTVQKQEDASERFKKYASFVGTYTAQLDKANNGNKAATDANKNLQGWKKMRDDAGEERNAAYHELKRLKPQYEKARERYERSAGHTVARLLNESSDAIDKAKKWISNAFKR